jgi:hypothetical protein
LKPGFQKRSSLTIYSAGEQGKKILKMPGGHASGTAGLHPACHPSHLQGLKNQNGTSEISERTADMIKIASARAFSVLPAGKRERRLCIPFIITG